MARTVFENIGGSYQFRARRPEDLYKVLELDATVWAALCVPVSSLNGDPAFFKALDDDGNGMVRVDEVKKSVDWLLKILNDISILGDNSDTISPEKINRDDAQGLALNEFVETYKSDLLDENNLIALAKVRAKIKALTSGPLAGDGMLRFKAVDGNCGEPLFDEITKLFKTPDGLKQEQLDKFIADAKSFLEWAKTTDRPLFRSDDPVKYFDVYKALADKIDEYFKYCDLIVVDPANARRFALDPAALPQLDLQDPSAVDKILKDAPLATPSAFCKLDLSGQVNPYYQKNIDNFIATFKLNCFNRADWESLKAEFTCYMEYLAKAQGDLTGQLGRVKLEEYLNNGQPEALQELFRQDQALGGVLDKLRQLERLLLFKKYMLEFINNFVSFEAFFDPGRNSMLQAGRLIMDGRSYNLAVWIDDIPSHRKIAMRSNLCLFYLEVTSSGKTPCKRKLAVAATGGSLNRIYVGKPAFFVDNDQVTYHGKIVDLIEGPISFWQTLISPFRRISEAISGKLQKMTDFGKAEKALTAAVNAGKLPPAPAPAPAQKNFLSNGSIMLLAGGLSLAAVGAALSVVVKSFSQAISTISNLPPGVILLWIVIILGIILIPAAIYAFLKLRKRNLTLFLEAGGWAVNLPMRLNMQVSGIFTRPAEYPADKKFKRNLFNRPGPRTAIFVLLCLIILAAGITALIIIKK